MDTYMLRTTDAQGRSYGGFQWPMEVGAVVTAPDWSPEPECGHGLHGALHGIGDGTLLSWESDALWWIIAVDPADVVDLGGKVKVPRGRVRMFGPRDAVVAEMQRLCPGVATIAGTATAGYRGTTTAGYRGTLMIWWHDGQRRRLVVGYVGEDGVDAGVPYRVEGGRLVRVCSPLGEPCRPSAGEGDRDG